jgi:hypothetical protein
MIKFLRKIFLVDFVLSLIRSKQNPHLRFARFLEVFALLWLLWALLLLVTGFKQDTTEVLNWYYRICWIGSGIGFFFFYRHVSKILKSYSEEDAAKFRYLRFLNPVAPVIYFTTVFMVVIIILNMIMLLFWALGLMLFFIGIIVTFGMLLFDDSYRLKDFIGVPQAFFEAEDYFLRNYMSLEVIMVFLIIIYFVIPISTSGMILWQHYKMNRNSKQTL